ncbi:H-NS family nucleoid-associated regulatory protein, partial [Klebsiella oxytoca]|uniref:H-NS family nucleoid-associated regulatory protein n=1 Tax=Klebsiella oxytoca TaxID=571 RepID=UPI003AAC255A
DVTLKMPAFEWVHVQLHQQKGMISLSPPTICNSAKYRDPRNAENTWSGTGRRPTWLKELLDSGLSLDDLKI